MGEAQALVHAQVDVDAWADGFRVFVQVIAVDAANAVGVTPGVFEDLCGGAEEVGVLEHVRAEDQDDDRAAWVGSEMGPVDMAEQFQQAGGAQRVKLSEFLQAFGRSAVGKVQLLKRLAWQRLTQAGEVRGDEGHEGRFLPERAQMIARLA
ncbi:hypothetical protein D3C79_604310 [compost metagenome]